MHVLDSSASTRGLTLTGTDGNDLLEGGDLDDHIYGLRGNDRLNGGAGNDYFEGGDETYAGDRIKGGAGNDTIHGGGGNDDLYGEEGDDFIDGGAGADTITDDAGANRLLGGDGNDRIVSLSPEASVLDGGAGHDIMLGGHANDAAFGGDGDDEFSVASRHSETGFQLTFDGGAGNDTLRLRGGDSPTALNFTTGEGRDTVYYAAYGGYVVTVTDFTAGAGGDVIDVTGMSFVGNPFATGSMRAVQQGDDLVLEWNQHVSGSTYAFAPIIILKGVTAGELTGENFMNGYRLDGSSAGMTLHGTEGKDTLYGGDQDDNLYGHGGEDNLNGGEGNDTLDGGAHNDVLDGSYGDDTLRGGEGNDRLDGGAGNDRLEGGAGNDFLVGGDLWDRAANRLEGGDGDDILHSLAGTDTLMGGAGNDELVAMTDRYSQPRTVTMYGGDGDDLFSMWSGVGSIVAEGGSGRDRFDAWGASSGDIFTVTDFEAGPGGDVLSVDPYRADAVRLLQRGADTVVQVEAFNTFSQALRDVVVLRNVAATTLTAENFAGGWLPPIASTATDPRTGSAAADAMTGTAFDDHLDGGGGDDEIHGLDGLDYLLGGAGADTLDGGAGGDVIAGGAGDDRLSGGAGNDVLYDWYGNNVLDGGDGDDNLHGGAGADTLLGGAGNDVIRLNYNPYEVGPLVPGRHIVIDAGSGNDHIVAAFKVAANVAVTGGAGIDTFSYDVYSDSAINITDFEAGAGGDIIRIDVPIEYAVISLVQRGADAIIEVDNDGPGLEAPREIIRLKNVNAADLTPENFHDRAMPAMLVSRTQSGSVGADVLSGGAGDDMLSGDGGDDLLVGENGNDTLSGGAGRDTARYDLGRSTYTIAHDGAQVRITDQQGFVDTLQDIERIVFADSALGFDAAGTDGQAYRLYQAAFNRVPDAAGVGYWMTMADNGLGMVDMARHFMASTEFNALYGNAPTSEELAALFYRNALHRDPDAAGLAYWTAALEGGADLAEVLVAFSESAENKEAVAPAIAAGFSYVPWG